MHLSILVTVWYNAICKLFCLIRSRGCIFREYDIFILPFERRRNLIIITSQGLQRSIEVHAAPGLHTVSILLFWVWSMFRNYCNITWKNKFFDWYRNSRLLSNCKSYNFHVITRELLLWTPLEVSWKIVKYIFQSQKTRYLKCCRIIRATFIEQRVSMTSTIVQKDGHNVA